MPTKTKTPTLPHRGTRVSGVDYHPFNLRIVMPLWTRMVAAGIAWGETTKFINDAIREKLDREHPETTPGK